MLMLSPKGQALELVLDEQPSITIDQIFPSLIVENDSLLSAEQLTQFSVDAYGQSIQPSPNGSWYKITLIGQFLNQEPQKRTIKIDSHILRHLQFYLYDGDTLVNKSQLGIIDTDNLLSHSDLNQYQGPSFQFYIQNNKPLTLLIYKQNNGPSILPMTVYNDEGLKQVEKKTNFFWGGIIFTLIVMALYNITVYAMHPNRAYLWYIGFHSLTIFYFGGLNGFGYLLFPLKLQIWLSQNIMVLNFLVIFMVLNFASTFLELKHQLPKYYKFVKPFSVLSLVGAFTSLWIPEYTMIPAFSILQLLGSIFGIGVAVIAFKKGYSPAKYFLLSWVFTISGGAIGMTTVLGVIPANFFTLHGFLFGTLAELFLFSVALAHRMKEMEASLLSQSYYYPDTEVANFSYIKNKLPEYLDKIIKKHENIAIIVASHQGFKEIIGLYGPAALTKAYEQFTCRANHFLASTEWAIAMPLPTGDAVYLAGLPGEQVFLMVDLGQCEKGTREELDLICNDIMYHSQQPSTIDKATIQVHTTLGCSLINKQDDLAEGFRQAQIALLSCKMRKQKWMLYEKDLDDYFYQRSALIFDLQQAITDEALELYIQPQLAPNQSNDFDKNLRVNSGEILLRWIHPTRGFVSPMEFIVLAEQSGLIFPITQLVFKKACLWLQRLKQLNPHALDQLSISINLSALDVAEAQLIPFISNTLEEYDIESKNILLEVTESAVMDNPATFLSTICKLKALGFRIAIDDFGTGYSSMQYLQTIGADEIKIDMAFIRDIHLDITKQNIVKAITQLAHATNAHTVAEGVENIEEAQYLQQLNIQLAQGYFWSKPIPLSEFEQTFLFKK
jgi:EAL domain-containing protein (putative c-di-GMP-specific phosphodiesterase class I)/GGDEF domain-containing protein